MITGFALFRKKSKHAVCDMIKMLPNLCTLMNAFFGFLSIITALEGNAERAAYFIIIATMLDFLDGQLARLCKSSSSIGLELDSLADAISFCLAPAILLYSSYHEEFQGLGVYLLGIYLCAGLWRLAKFNTTSTQQAQAFIGLPTTMAAAFVANLILAEPWIVTHPVKIVLYKYGLFFCTILIALLMISSIPFPSNKKLSKMISQDFFKILIALICFVVCLFRGYPIMLSMLILYIFFGISTFCFALCKKLFFASVSC
jgi:CDP-diacylglycerol---serine O-phosphatidyltransferase